ncbi:hypothetical protein ITX31_01185 [Arthrobacter gandavensis]|nr:hypothetical protein [Arthrobacter gandavensis]MBF4992726.1 hypothetical protein [Arthrobacter gandavensis]
MAQLSVYDIIGNGVQLSQVGEGRAEVPPLALRHYVKSRTGCREVSTV